MFRSFTRTRLRKTVLGVSAVTLVGASTGGTYYFSKLRRTPSTPVDETTPTVIEAETKEEPSGQDEIAKPFVYQSRVISHRHDALSQYDSSMIIDDETVGFSRSDSVVLSDAEGYNTWIRLPSRTLSLFMIFQGHNGPHTAQWLRTNMTNALIENLSELFSRYAPVAPKHSEVDEENSAPMGYPPPEEVDDALFNTFLQLDEELVHRSLEQVWQNRSKFASVETLDPARSGSSALVSLFETETKTLRVAHVGTTRAILGRHTGQRFKGQKLYETHVLTNEHTPRVESERALIASRLPSNHSLNFIDSHPVTRSFGDAALKWGQDIQQRLHEEYLGDPPNPQRTHAPYITATPEISSVEIRDGDFMVIATDGLWQSLTNEEVVGLVGWWINQRDSRRYAAPLGLSPRDHWNKYSFDDTKWYSDSKRSEELPAVRSTDGDKTVMYKRWNIPKKFVNVDSNAATHLVRNAMGGADRELTDTLLAMNLPLSKRFKPDIGISVVFFNDVPLDDE